MPSTDSAYWEVELRIPDVAPQNTNDGARMLAIAERLRVRPRMIKREHPTFVNDRLVHALPFWFCVIAKAGEGFQWRVLSHAHKNPEWREAAMGLWRLGGLGMLRPWVRQQMKEMETP